MTSNTDALLSLRQQSQPLMMWVEFRDFCSHIIEIASTQSRSFPLWMAHRLVSIIFPSLAVLSVALFFFFLSVFLTFGPFQALVTRSFLLGFHCHLSLDSFPSFLRRKVCFLSSQHPSRLSSSSPLLCPHWWTLGVEASGTCRKTKNP